MAGNVETGWRAKGLWTVLFSSPVDLVNLHGNSWRWRIAGEEVACAAAAPGIARPRPLCFEKLLCSHKD
jgi:hypothetical protein